MNRIATIFATTLLATSLTGCFTVVEEGKVAVRTNSVGVIQGNELPGGDWYQTTFGTLLEFTTRDIALDMNDKAYTTKEDVPLSDFDMTITYGVNPASVAETYKTRSKAYNRMKDGDIQLLANRVETLANGVAYKVIRQYASLEAADNRSKIEQEISKALVTAISEDKLADIITITSVTVRSILPNKEIQNSSIAVVKSANELKVKDNEVQIALKQAEVQKALSANGPQTIAYMNAQAALLLAQAAKEGKVQTILIPHGMTMFSQK